MDKAFRGSREFLRAREAQTHQLTGNHIIVNPSGPGVGPNTTTLADQITLEAMQ
jgi:hypothetical protein